MKWLFLVVLLVSGCSDSIFFPEEDCHCEFEISSTLPSTDGIYQLEFNASLAQTYSVLDVSTECGWANHIQWDSDYMYNINGYPTSLVNPGSMTDEDGNAKVVFAVWEEFINTTITIYGGYTDDHGHHKLDSVKVHVIDNE
jgi:hypothetical protein